MRDKYELLMKISSDLEELKAARREVKDFQKEFTNLGSVLGMGAKLNIGAQISNVIAKIPGVIKASVDAYAEREAAETRLQAALRQSGAAVDEMLPRCRELSREIQRMTAVGGKQVGMLQAQALNMGVSADRLDVCIKSAVGLSKAFGIDMTRALKLSAQAAVGQTGGFNELLPALKNCRTEAERLSLVNKAAAAGYAQAQAEADTLSGALEQLSNEWSDISAILGEAVVPVVKSVADLLGGLAGMVNDNKDAVVAFIQSAPNLKALLIIKDIYDACFDSTEEFKEELKKLQAELEATSNSQRTVSDTMLAALRKEGASRAELAEIAAECADKVADAHARMALAKSRGLDTKPIETEIIAHEKLAKAAMDEAAAFEKLYNAKKWEAAEKGRAAIAEAVKKYSFEQLSNEQKIAALSEKIAGKNAEIYRMRLAYNEAEGEAKQAAGERIAALVEELGALEKQHSQVQKAVATEKKASEDKKAAADKALRAANERIRKLNDEWRLEEEITRAKIDGNAKAAEGLETQKKAAAYAAEIVAAHTEDKMTADQLAALQAEALKKAQDRVDLENRLADIEKEREALKNRQATAEDYIYRLLIAQAEAAGEMAKAEKLRQQQKKAQEIERLTKDGWNRDYAERMVNRTYEAEEKADKAKHERDENAGGRGEPSGARRRTGMERAPGGNPRRAGNPSRPTRPSRPAGPTRPAGYDPARAEELRKRNRMTPLQRRRYDESLRRPAPAYPTDAQIKKQAAKTAEEHGKKKSPEDTAKPAATPESGAAIDAAGQVVQAVAELRQKTESSTKSTENFLKSIDAGVKKVAAEIKALATVSKSIDRSTKESSLTTK